MTSQKKSGTERNSDLSRHIQAKEDEIQDFNRLKNGFLEVISDFSSTAKQAQEMLMENNSSTSVSEEFETHQAFENEQLLLQDMVRKTRLIESDLVEESQKHSLQLQKDLDVLESLKRKERLHGR
ncbi:MAG: hypothetical protein LBS33_02370 [Streptococcaceae bacterium]|jgi:hypothetical protein|nr:hypothetical protein [Streptococcaceae bacterium]